MIGAYNPVLRMYTVVCVAKENEPVALTGNLVA